jgi:hypothetical protein
VPAKLSGGKTNNIRIPLIKIKISTTNTPVRALVDTGSATNVIKKKLVSCIDTLTNGPRYLISASGTLINILGKTVIDVNIGEKIYKIDFLIVETLPRDIILGTSFLVSERATLDFDRRELCLTHSNRVPFELSAHESVVIKQGIKRNYKVSLAGNNVIVANEDSYINVNFLGENDINEEELKDSIFVLNEHFMLTHRCKILPDLGKRQVLIQLQGYPTKKLFEGTVVQQEASWELFELMTTPFAWNNHTCTIMHDTMYLAVSSHHSGRSLRPISGSSLHTCKPFENKLCYIARFNSHGSYGPQCALKMYTGATVDELNSHCAFRCHESQAMIISEVQDDVYVITHPQPMMLIQCGKTTQDIITSAVGKPGALQVHLPCNCQLRLKEDVVIPTRYPCGGNTPPATGLMHVLPATWSNLKSLHLKPLLHDTHPTFDNFTECLDTNWTLRVPHVNLSTNILDDDIFRTVQTNLQSLWDSYTPYEAHSDASVLIWNIVLSLAVLYLYRQNRLLAAAISRFPPAEASALSSRDLTSCLVVAFTALFLGLLSMWLYWKLYGRKGKLFKRKTVTDTERGAELEDLQEVDEELKELNRLRLPVLHPGIAKPRLHREATPSVGSY